MSADRFRRIALSLPEVVEGAHHGTADFRVGKRIFATLGYPDQDWGMVKLTPEQQAMVVEAEPEISGRCRAAGARAAAPMSASRKRIRSRCAACSKWRGTISR
ncbi:hypothetical protein ACVWZM_006008 [Bradyrhizobium sp. USDA 4501]